MEPFSNDRGVPREQDADFPPSLASFFAAYAERGEEELRSVEEALEAEKSNQRGFAGSVLEATSIGIQYLGPEGKVRWANPAALRMLGFAADDYVGSSFADLHVDAALLEVALRRLRSGKSTGAYEATLKGKDGTQRHVAVAMNVQRDGGSVVYPCFLFDITARKSAEVRLRHLALHDPLTTVPNRTFLTGVLRRALAKQRRDRSARFALLVLDLDRFKEINDRLGHLVGDRLLKEVARRITCCCRGSDTVARLGGDEFAVLIESVRDDEEACLVAQRIHRAIGEPLVVGSTTLYVTASVGIALARRDASADEMVHDADMAMYRAKCRGRGNSELAFGGGPSGVIAGFDELRASVDRKDHLLLFQPVVSLRTGAIVGLEAMVRLRRSDGSLVYPADFVALAESTGLMPPISRWVIGNAIAQIRKWQLQFPAVPLFVAANVSPVVASSAGFADEVVTMLRDGGVDPRCLWLEVNEETLLDERVVKALLRLSDVGVNLALDDFGSRFTSFLRLKALPIGAVKLEASTTRSSGSARDTTLWRGLVGLAHDLGMTVVAEGIEDQAHVDEARRLGCNLAQGFHLGRPIPADTVEALLGMPLPPMVSADVRRSGAGPGAANGMPEIPHPARLAGAGRPGAATVLVVEDDPESRELLAELLMAHGYVVATAHDGAAALEAIHGGLLPDLIILDLMMPAMDGWTFRSRLKDDPRLATIPVVVLSGVAEEGATGDLSPAAWFTKPVSFRKLEEAIRQHC